MGTWWEPACACHGILPNYVGFLLHWPHTLRLCQVAHVRDHVPCSDVRYKEASCSTSHAKVTAQMITCVQFVCWYLADW